MLFNSLEFLLFFPLVAIIYFAIPKNNWRNYFLLVASYYFYMCWKPEYALLLLTSTGLTYVAANLIGGGKKYKQFYLIACIVLNLAILFFFKYYHFAAENITALMQLFGVQLHIPEMNVLLPVGISFYIFQALGYSIDVYRGDVEPEKNFFKYALFVSFFPQLVAGPIERSTNLLQQFKTKHQFDGDRAISGVNLMLWGYFLKMVIADRCAIYVDSVYNNMAYQNGSACLLATLLFAIQIYGDFAGYTYIAIGCSRVMGFNLSNNFLRPYFSSSVSDFWRRWHISLSRWLRDYVYISLGGSRKGKNRTYVNLLATMFISGIWHGANWTFVVWGMLHGVALCIERALGINKRDWHGLRKFLHVMLTFFLVSLFWVFFRANTLSDGLTCVQRICSNVYPFKLDVKPGIFIWVTLLILFIAEYCIEYKKVEVNDHNSLKVYALCSMGLLTLILGLGIFDGGQFIYFQF